MIKFGPIEKLGTVWWFEFFDLKNENKEDVEKKLLEVMEKFENDYSRFRDISFVSLLNKKKKIENPSSEMQTIIKQSLDFFDLTDGVFNICVGDYLEMIGYDKDYNFGKKIEKLPEVPDPKNVLSVSSEEIKIEGDYKIDFGGIGKGFLIDKLADVLKNEFGLNEFLINGGGDIYATEISTGTEKKGIEISLKDPNSDGFIGKVTLQNQGFAASSPNLRSWKGSDGKTYSHIVGSEKPQNTFIVAPSATEADVWATSLSIKPDLELPEGVFGKVI